MDIGISYKQWRNTFDKNFERALTNPLSYGKINNKEVRIWYNVRASEIPVRLDKSLSLEEQAHQAFDMRNEIREEARNLMSDRKLAAELDRKYPMHDFDELLESKMQRKTLTRDEGLKDMIMSASKPSKAVNKALGL